MVTTTEAKVVAISPLTDRILLLMLEPDTYIEYQAGQYLQLFSDDQWVSYSIANAPLGAKHYELHIRHDPQNQTTQRLIADIKEQGRVMLQLPFGDCHVNQLAPLLPIIFIAGGTGFAPIKAMIEHLLVEGEQRNTTLYWCVKGRSDLYLSGMVEQWQEHISHFHYHPLISENGSKEDLMKLLIQTYDDKLTVCQYVIGGPFDMVYSVRDALLEVGVQRDHLYSDAFAFEEKKG